MPVLGVVSRPALVWSAVMRKTLGMAALLMLLSLALGAPAQADVPPEPGRPEWNETPLPMPPAPPAAVVLLALGGVALLGTLVAVRRQRGGASC